MRARLLRHLDLNGPSQLTSQACQRWLVGHTLWLSAACALCFYAVPQSVYSATIYLGSAAVFLLLRALLWWPVCDLVCWTHR